MDNMSLRRIISKSVKRLQVYRDLTVLKRPSTIVDFFKILIFIGRVNNRLHVHHHAKFREVKPLLAYREFSNFKMAAIRHIGLSTNKNFHIL